MKSKIIKALILCSVIYFGIYGANEYRVSMERRVEELTVDLRNTRTSLYQTTNELRDTREQLVGAQEALNGFINPAPYGRAAAPTYDIVLSDELQQYTYDTFVVYGIEEHYELVLALMWHESNFVVDAVSATEDYGLMQINICNHDFLCETLDFVDIIDAKNNIEAGIYILSTLFNRFDDVDQVLMAYNMGEGNAAEQWDRGNYTSSYSTAVLERLEQLEQK